jgi:hypothetical protein
MHRDELRALKEQHRQADRAKTTAHDAALHKVNSELEQQKIDNGELKAANNELLSDNTELKRVNNTLVSPWGWKHYAAIIALVLAVLKKRQDYIIQIADCQFALQVADKAYRAAEVNINILQQQLNPQQPQAAQQQAVQQQAVQPQAALAPQP